MSNFLIDEDTDLLAAEFVLGTLDSAERANAQSLLRTDHGFIAMVRIWERRFGELHLMVEPVEPDAKITQRIKAKILEISGQRAPESEPQAEPTAGPELPKTVAPPENAELPQPADVAAAGTAVGDEIPEPQDVPVTAPAPAEIPATGEAETPVETPPDSAVPAPAEAAAAVAVSTSAVSPEAAPLELAPPEVAPPAAPEVVAPPEVAPPAAEAATAAEIPQPPEPPATSDGGLTAKVDVPPQPPPSLKPSDRPSDKSQEQRSARRSEIDVIRSRGRWRMLGVCMTLLVMGLVALLAAWRFVPDRVPPGLRPAALMLSVGIQTLPKPAPVVKQAPPEPQFDE